MFLQKSDFDKIPNNVPAKQLATEDGTAFSATFSAYVDTEVENILKKILGIRLYDEFIEGLEADYPEDRWLDLRDGAQYEYNGILYEWGGLVKMLTPFITAKWLRDNYDNWSDVGVSVGKIENADSISPDLRIVMRWNEFYEHCGNKKKVNNSLYGFLLINFDASYPDWVFTDPGNLNRFNL